LTKGYTSRNVGVWDVQPGISAQDGRAERDQEGASLRFVHSLIRRAGLSVRPTLKNDELGVRRSRNQPAIIGVDKSPGLTSQLVGVQVSR